MISVLATFKETVAWVEAKVSGMHLVEDPEPVNIGTFFDVTCTYARPDERLIEVKTKMSKDFKSFQSGPESGETPLRLHGLPQRQEERN